MGRLTGGKYDYSLRPNGFCRNPRANQVSLMDWIESPAKADFFPHRIAPSWMILADEDSRSAKK
jgi:hypothetical protein